MAKTEQGVRWFNPSLDWGKIGKVLASIAGAGFLVIQAYVGLRSDLQQTQAAIHDLAQKIEASNTQRDDHIAALRSEFDLRVRSMESRMNNAETRLDAQDRDSRNTAATVAGMKEQINATYNAVARLTDALLPRQK